MSQDRPRVLQDASEATKQACQITSLGIKNAKIHMQIGPKATQKHDKWTLESWEFQPLRFFFFLQYLLCKMLGFPSLDIQIQTQKLSENEACKQA